MQDSPGPPTGGGGMHPRDRVALAGVHDVGSATQAGLVEAAGDKVNGDDGVGTRHSGKLNGELPDGARAENSNGLVELERTAADAVERNVTEDAQGCLFVGNLFGHEVGLGLPVFATVDGEGNEAVAGVVAEAEDAVTLAVVGDAGTEFLNVTDGGIADGSAHVRLVLNGADAVHFRACADLAARDANKHLVGAWIRKLVLFDFNGDSGAGNETLTLRRHFVSPVPWMRRPGRESVCWLLFYTQ